MLIIRACTLLESTLFLIQKLCKMNTNKRKCCVNNLFQAILKSITPTFCQSYTLKKLFKKGTKHESAPSVFVDAPASAGGFLPAGAF